MWYSYFKIAWRNLFRQKAFSLINIGGLAVGMAIAILIGLWMHDELSYNKYHQNYHRIAQVMQHVTFNGEKSSLPYNPYHLATLIRNDYGADFKYALMSTFTSDHLLEYGNKKLSRKGNYMEPEAPRLLSLQMLKGTLDGLQDPSSILLSESVAKAFFGKTDPVGKLFRIDNKSTVKVTGVYKDLPYNSDFKDMTFIAPWDLLMTEAVIKAMANPWDNNNFQTLVQLADYVEMDEASAKIKDLRVNNMPKESAGLLKPVVFLHPMSKWHLYEEFKNGINTGGRVAYVWLFGLIGGFVLFLACINFMNLSTARSQKRAKEVGIRKTLGSRRIQLMNQFFSESLLVVAFAFGLSLLLVQLTLPSFNEIADKNITIPLTNPWFYVAIFSFCLITGIAAGIYPALYLSSFKPVKVLKGTFTAGRFAALPRKVLVVVQFTVSVILIIGTLVVFRQIQLAKDRPIGYQQDGLIQINMTPAIQKHFGVIRNELKEAGVVAEMAASANPPTDYAISNADFEWKGKDADLALEFPISNVTPEYGKTIGWQIKEGRDFSKEFATDSAAFILNEAAVKFMRLKNPIGETIKWNGKPFQVIGVIKDIIFESPYWPVRPYIYQMTGDQSYFVTLKIHPNLSAGKALGEIETVFKKYNPATPFDYKFVDEEYTKKYGNEERIGRLAAIFTFLAIFISCLGLFGLASFVAEQRTKEIGIRKVLGASVTHIWALLSKEFLALVILACFISAPIAWYFLHKWLQNYEYRTTVSWWIFAAAGFGAILITLLTVSFQALKAALANPVKSLRSE